ncbi:MAG: addiction module protein [Verrucomicrobiota bacterium]
MIAIDELRSLPVAERLRLVEDLWNSIAEDPNCLADSPAVVAELRARKARFMANPTSGILWQHAKKKIQSLSA